MRSRIIAAFFLLVAATAISVAAEDTSCKATWPPVACRVDGLSEQVLGGVYEVHENRASRSGAKIPISVVVLPATGKERLPDPLVFFAGGPGDSVIDGAGFVAATYKGLRANRDIVLIDVRGTGRSAALMCTELTGKKGVQSFLTEFLPAQGVADCYERLKTHDLSQYNTDSATDDVHEICTALGYKQVNLHGASYGTRAALVYMRRHPENVRSAVLIGVAPTGDRLPLFFARDAQNALDDLLDECAQDPDCNKAFPNVRDEFRSVYEKLKAEPVSVNVKDPSTGEPIPLTLSGPALAQTIRYMLYVPQTALQVPHHVHAAAAGNFQPIADTAYFFSKALGAGGLSDGFYLCVTCAEDLPWISETEIGEAVKGTFLGDFRIRQQQAACAKWPVGKVSPEYLKPVVSDVPTLIISGERDPVTPASAGDLVASTLSHSRHIVVPDGAHAFDGLKGAECVDEVITKFILAGSVDSLDVSCVNAIERPSFLMNVKIESAIQLTAERLRSYVGKYVLEGAGLSMDVNLETGSLRALLPGQPPLMLEPISETRFRFVGLPHGYFVEFRVSGAAVVGAKLEAGAGSEYELARQPTK